MRSQGSFMIVLASAKTVWRRKASIAFHGPPFLGSDSFNGKCVDLIRQLVGKDSVHKLMLFDEWEVHELLTHNDHLIMR